MTDINQVEDEEFEYLSEEEIEKAKSVSVFSNIFYVYFDESGEILTITNEKKQDSTHGFLELEHKRVEKFLEGRENFSNYKVSLVDKTTPALVKKTQESVYTTNVFKVIDRVVDKDTVLVVEWDKGNKSWNFYIQDEYQKQLSELGLSASLLFFVTLNDNINFLVRKMPIDLKELVRLKTISIPFISEAELDVSRLSLSTRKFFDTYGLVVNE